MHLKYIEEEKKRKDANEDWGEIDWKELTQESGRDLRLLLQKIYYSKARVLTKTIAYFIQGYREGRQEVEDKAKAKEQQSRPE